MRDILFEAWAVGTAKLCVLALLLLLLYVAAGIGLLVDVGRELARSIRQRAIVRRRLRELHDAAYRTRPTVRSPLERAARRRAEMGGSDVA